MAPLRRQGGTRGDETAAANRRGATCDARCPTGAQRPRRTCTASIAAYRINRCARNRACMRRPSGRHKWRPYGGASGGAERGAVKLRLRNVGAPLVTPGAPLGHNVPAASALRQSPHTASTVVPATVRACVGFPGVINGAPTEAVSVAAMKHGDETAATNRRGATCDARCPYGAQRPRRTCTASIAAYRVNRRARNRACMRRFSGRHKWCPYGGGVGGGSANPRRKRGFLLSRHLPFTIFVR